VRSEICFPSLNFNTELMYRKVSGGDLSCCIP
jgi:hypothetical protein